MGVAPMAAESAAGQVRAPLQLVDDGFHARLVDSVDGIVPDAARVAMSPEHVNTMGRALVELCTDTHEVGEEDFRNALRDSANLILYILDHSVETPVVDEDVLVQAESHVTQGLALLRSSLGLRVLQSAIADRMLAPRQHVSSLPESLGIQAGPNVDGVDEAIVVSDGLNFGYSEEDSNSALTSASEAVISKTKNTPYLDEAQLDAKLQTVHDILEQESALRSKGADEQTLEMTRRPRLQAEEMILLTHQPFIRMIYQKYFRNRDVGKLLPDILQAGNEGMLTAIRRFDPSRGYTIRTYSELYILRAMQACAGELTYPTKLTAANWDRVSTLRSIRSSLFTQLDRPPTMKEIAATYNSRQSVLDGTMKPISLLTVERLLVLSRSVAIGRALHDKTGDLSAEEVVVRGQLRRYDAPSPEDYLMDRLALSQLRAIFAQALEAMTPSQREVTEHRLQSTPAHRVVNAEIGELMGISGERVRQLNDRAKVIIRQFFATADTQPDVIEPAIDGQTTAEMADVVDAYAEIVLGGEVASFDDEMANIPIESSGTKDTGFVQPISPDTDALSDISLIEEVISRDDQDPTHQDVIDWRDMALCAQVDAEIFYPDKGGSAVDAIRVCSRCDVIEQCLDYAIDRKERYGIWGGYTPRGRVRIMRERNIPVDDMLVDPDIE